MEAQKGIILCRRALLQRMALAGGTAVVAPLLTSTSALADSGSLACRATGLGGTVSLTLTRASGQDTNVSGTLAFAGLAGGSCPCSPGVAPTIRYAYWLQVRVYEETLSPAPSGTWTGATTDWSLTTAINAVTSTGLPNLNGPRPYEVDLQVGWRAECPGSGETPARLCRFAELTSGRTVDISPNGIVWTVTDAAVSENGEPTQLTGC